MNAIKTLISIVILTLTFACSHPIEIIGDGDVTSASGSRNCYLEDFRSAKENCSRNTVIGAYNETYYAVPRIGWKFERWAKYCEDSTTNSCAFNIPAELVRDNWGKKVPPLIAIFSENLPVGNFIPLGDLPGGAFGSSASDVSADGSVVVGNASGASGREPFRWTSATGVVGLGDLQRRTTAEAVSADGDVIVGWFQAVEFGDIEAFRWTSAGGMVGLGDLPGGCFQSEAFDVSANGSVVVGTGCASGGLEAFRWTSTGGMVGLGDLPPSVNWSDARGVSVDGSVVVGFGSGSFQFEATRWTSATGMVGLGVLGGNRDSQALDVSADGSVIVGRSGGDLGGEAFLWTSAGGMMGLGYLPGGGAESRALGVSADGNVVVGQSQADATSEAFVWTQADGMQSLRNVLIANGVKGLDNWELREATSISANGQWVVGNGINPSGDQEAFLANIATP